MTLPSNKIVHIIEATATGTLSMAALLANTQKKSGHEVFVIFSIRPETPEDLINYFANGIQLLQVQMHTPIEKIKCLPKLRGLLKEVNPDCIFMHSSFSGFLGRLSSIFAKNRAKFLYIPHCISFMRQDVGITKKLVFILFEWFASIKKSDYIACSASEQKAIRAAIPFRKCHLVENALDFSAIPKSPNLDLSSRKRSVITVGQIRSQKGPSIFSEIAHSVKEADPLIDFIWVGDGDPESRSMLENAGVRVIGWVPKNQVWQHLGDASLYLSTALWEGMPVSVIEASFAGLPVVASNCAGNIDVIEHEKTGWIFNTADEAKNQILSSLSNPQLSQSIAKTAFDIAKQRFSVERYFQEMEALTKY